MRNDPPQMRYANFAGDERIDLLTVQRPDAGTGEALVRVSGTALCGSDFKLWRNGAQFIAGHEICGYVEQGGHPLDGRLCAIYIPEHCGICDACLAGYTQSCLTISSLIGWNRDGGYAEYVVAPDNCLLPVPDDIEEALAPLLLDTIGTSAHALREAARHCIANPSILILGAGPVGLGVVLAAKALGYHEIAVAEPNSSRAALAVEFGAKEVPVGDRSQRYDLIVECSGSHAARDLAIELVLPRGVIVLVGENSEPWKITEDKVFRRKTFSMLRTFYFPKSDFSANVELLRANKADYARLVSAVFPLDDLPVAFADFARGKSIKPVLGFGAAGR